MSFHRYGDEVRKAVEEHLVEGAQYAAAGGEVKIHFTVSPEHLTRFEALLAEKIPGYESRFGVKYRISFSVQDPSTDTLAVNPDCTPFRRADGRLLFRPAGHGALIGNLGKIDADIVFVKNIDNVTTDARRGDTVLYKKRWPECCSHCRSGFLNTSWPSKCRVPSWSPSPRSSRMNSA